jgi:hypothetical protein|tara:strand:- start:345 stop:671 length:327 start_codon:yes stop_codon:yes gene_type:complete
MSKILKHPRLSPEGFGEYEKPINEFEIQQAVKWLEEVARDRSTVNRKITSYGWKHIAEKNSERKYISNGAFIFAAIKLGFLVKCIEDGPNAYINISSKSIKGRGGYYE